MFDFDDLDETLTPEEEQRQQKVVEQAQEGLESPQWNLRRDACRLISTSNLGAPAAGLLLRLKELSGNDDDYEVRKAARGAILSLATAGIVLPASEIPTPQPLPPTSNGSKPIVAVKAAPSPPQPPVKRWSAEDETDEEDQRDEEEVNPGDRTDDHHVQHRLEDLSAEVRSVPRPEDVASVPATPGKIESEKFSRPYVGHSPASSSTSHAYPTHSTAAAGATAPDRAAARWRPGIHEERRANAAPIRLEPTPTSTSTLLKKPQPTSALATVETPKLQTKFPLRNGLSEALPEYPFVLLDVRGEVSRMRLEHRRSTPAEVIDTWVNSWGLTYAARIRFQAQPEEDKKWLNNAEDFLPESPFVVRLECNVGSILQSLLVACKDYGHLSAAEARELREAKSRGSNSNDAKVQRDRVKRSWKEGPSLIPSDPAVDAATKHGVPTFDQFSAQKGEARHRLADRWADEEQKQRQKEQRARQGLAHLAGLKATLPGKSSRDLT